MCTGLLRQLSRNSPIDAKLTKKPKTLAAYTTHLDYFTESCPKQYLEDEERRDLLRFVAFLRDDKEPGAAQWRGCLRLLPTANWSFSHQNYSRTNCPWKGDLAGC
jgi:hypothetical protein